MTRQPRTQHRWRDVDYPIPHGVADRYFGAQQVANVSTTAMSSYRRWGWSQIGFSRATAGGAPSGFLCRRQVRTTMDDEVSYDSLVSRGREVSQLMAVIFA